MEVKLERERHRFMTPKLRKLDFGIGSQSCCCSQQCMYKKLCKYAFSRVGRASAEMKLRLTAFDHVNLIKFRHSSGLRNIAEVII
jgi:hypothetical protein